MKRVLPWLGLASAPLLLAGLSWLLAAPAAPSAESRAAAQRVEAGWAYSWLVGLQKRFPAREPGTQAHRGGVELIAESFHEATGAVRVDSPADGPRGPIFNVLARVRGRDPARRVLLAAHHDSVPGAPGAIDDGGAVAALLAAARALRAGPPPPCDVEFAIFDYEEWGLLGAKAHARAEALSSRPSHLAVVAVELVGWHQDDLVAHTIPHGFAWDAPGIAPAWLPAALRRAGRAAGQPVGLGDPLVSPWYQATIRVLSVQTGSDAGAFSELGHPAAMLTGSSLSNFYAHYHQPSDDLSQVDPTRLDDAARVVTAAAWELGALSDPPRALGAPYLDLGERVLGRAALGLIQLLAALALGLAAVDARRLGRGAEALGLAGLWAALVGLGALASPLGALCFVPLASALVVARHLAPAGRVLLLLLGAAPALIEVLLVVAASSNFGFGWRGGAAETGLILLALAASVLASAASESPGPNPPALKSD